MSTILSAYSAIIHNPGLIIVFKGLWYTAPLWVTFIVASVAWNVWLTYRRAKFINEQTYVLLEIRLPKEIHKSPLAMEFLFNALHSGGGEDKLKFKWREKEWKKKITNDYYWKGSVRPWYSLEICAIDGKIHFFIWTRAGARKSIEAQLYSQFPGIEIYEAADYTLPVVYDSEKMGLAAAEFELTKHDSFPIKTYVDYGMDKNPKEEHRIDPLTPLIEFLGSLGPSQNAWVQIGITAHKAEDKDPADPSKTVDLKWSEGAKKQIQDILDKAKPPKPKEGEQPTSSPRSLTEGEKETIAAIERSVSKRGFDTVIRVIYFAPKDVFSPANIGGVISGITHFNSNNLNGFKPNTKAGINEKGFGYDDEKAAVLYAYKNRGFFWNEFKAKSFVLNTEELATLYHFPSDGGLTPAFERIASKKSEAPANLPM